MAGAEFFVALAYRLLTTAASLVAASLAMADIWIHWPICHTCLSVTSFLE